MNTNQESQVSSVKRVGRPRKPDSTKFIFLKKVTVGSNTESKALGRGRHQSGDTLLKVEVHRQVNSKNYKHGVTPVVSTSEVVVPPLPPKVVGNNISVEVLAENPVAVPVAVAPVDVPVAETSPADGNEQKTVQSAPQF